MNLSFFPLPVISPEDAATSSMFEAMKVVSMMKTKELCVFFVYLSTVKISNTTFPNSSPTPTSYIRNKYNALQVVCMCDIKFLNQKNHIAEKLDFK